MLLSPFAICTLVVPYADIIGWTDGQTDGQNDGLTDNMQFFVWHSSQNLCQTMIHTVVPAFHTLVLIAWLADGDSLMCYIVTMGRQIAKMFSTFSL